MLRNADDSGFRGPFDGRDMVSVAETKVEMHASPEIHVEI